MYTERTRKVGNCRSHSDSLVCEKKGKLACCLSQALQDALLSESLRTKFLSLRTLLLDPAPQGALLSLAHTGKALASVAEWWSSYKAQPLTGLVPRCLRS